MSRNPAAAAVRGTGGRGGVVRPDDDVLGRRPAPPWQSPRQVLYDNGFVRIGTFRAAPSHPRFHDTGPILAPVFVFPRTSVRIAHRGSRPFVTTPNVVTYYNRSQEYLRWPVDPAGDLSEWFTLRDDVVLAVLSSLEPSVEEHADRPFKFQHGPCDPRSYLVQRLLVRHVARGTATEPLLVDELAVLLLHRLAGEALGAAAKTEVTPAYREIAEHLKTVLGTRFHEDLTLAQLSVEVGCSPFYLARVFRTAENTSIHQYRVRVRLARSLEQVAAGRELRVVASELGFSSHSHFSATFHRTFGLTPSDLRRKGSTAIIELLRARLEPKPMPDLALACDLACLAFRPSETRN